MILTRERPPRPAKQHFFSFFKTLVGKEVIVELKNDLAIKGTLHSVDQVWSYHWSM